MVEWRVYGCGSPSSFRSTQTSYEIAEGDNSLHIDLGPGSIYRRCLHHQSIETTVDSIRHLVITHNHPDHCFDMARLYVAWMYTPGFKPKNRVRLYGTEITLEGLDRMMKNIRLEGGFEKVFDPVILAYEKPYRIDQFQVTAFSTGHIEGACGLRIQSPSGKQVVFTSDTGPTQELPQNIQNADLLIIECSFFDLHTPYHLNLHEVAAITQTINPECVMLVHFYPDMERRTTKEIRAILKNHYAGPLCIAKDGFVIKWDPKKEAWIKGKLF